MTDDQALSVTQLRTVRREWKVEQFPPMTNVRLLEAFRDDNTNDRAPIWMMR